MRKLKIIISGGGTGGHIFPALAIAKSIEKKALVDLLFVGAKDRMEMEKIPAEGYSIKGLWISGFQRNLSIRNLIFPFKLVYSIFQARRILKEFQPDLVIGTGGYASGPLIFSASLRGVPAVIQEQNSYPGVTNKILSKYVENICVAYDNMDRFFPKEKLVFTGNPIRDDILKHHNKVDEGIKFFSIDKAKPTVLILGGSLGAKTINNAIADKIDLFKEMNINLIWQTGDAFKIQAEECVKNLSVSGINTYAFIKNMDLAYAVADIIVSRAGAIAISELCCVGKSVILVPSPNVSENHQYKNAQSLVNKNAALLVEDSQAIRKLVDDIIMLTKNRDLQKRLSSNIKLMAIEESAHQIAEIALGLIKK